MNGLPVEHALSHLLSGAPDAALRWSIAALEAEPSSPAALVVTARALARLGRKRAAIDGFFAAARRAAAVGEAPIALAAIADLRALEVDAEKLLAEVAAIVCREATPDVEGEETSAWGGSLQPVSPLLTRHELAARATELIYEAAGTERPRPNRSAFLGSFSAAAFCELARAFRAIVVPAGYRAIEEGGAVRDVFVIASGEVEIGRSAGRAEARSLATLGSGALFGEMSMLARLPAATSALTTRPTILLVAPRTTLEAISARHKDLRLELGAHCRRQAVGNLGAACAVMTAVPARSRGPLVDRMISRLYARGDRLVDAGEDVAGLHLILAGDVALVGRDSGDERVVLSTLGAGDVVGEAELVLCRRADTEAIAAGPTATLFLPRDEYFALALDHSSIVHGLYTAAVRRLGETGDALRSGATDVADTDVQLDELAPAIDPGEAEVPADVLAVSPAPGGMPRPEPDARELESVRNAEPAPEPAPRSEPEPMVTLLPAQMAAEIARARPASSPPPLTSTASAFAREPTLPGVGGAAPPSTLAPVAAGSSLPPRPSPPPASPPSSLGRRSAQGAALVVVAASLAALLTTRDDRPSALNLPARTPPAAEEPVPPAVTVAPVAAAQAPASAPSVPATGAVEARSPAPSAAAAPGPASSPPPVKAFLASSLKKRSAKSAGPDESASPADEAPPLPSAAPTPERAAPTASASPVPSPALAPSAKPAARTTAGDSPFGGRE